MKRALSAVLVVLALLAPSLVAAAPWAVVAAQFFPPEAGGPYYDHREGIFTVDVGAVPPRVYGPFFQGVLTETAGGGLFDVAALPNGRDVLVSNFGDMKIYKINVANPKAPGLYGELKIEYDSTDPFTGDPVTYSFFAEDISVARDGSFAIVSDGGFSSYLAFVDPNTFRMKKIQYTVVPNPRFPTDPARARTYSSVATAISPDGKMVFMVDYFTSKIHYATVNATKDGVTNFRSIFLCDQVDPADKNLCTGVQGRPINISISPDGRTGIVAIASVDKGGNSRLPGRVAVLKIDPATGTVTKGTPFWVTGLPGKDALSPPAPSGFGGNQSVAIAANGAHAYVLTQPLGDVDDPDSADPLDKVNRYNVMAKLKVNGPGQVGLVSAKYAGLRTRGTSQLFGVDTLAVDGSGTWVIAANATVSGGTNVLTAKNALTGATRYILLPSQAIPVGVAFTR